MSELIRQHPADKLAVTIERDGVKSKMFLTPELDKKLKIGFIGVTASQETIKRKYGVLNSIIEGTKKNIYLYGLTFEILYKLIAGQISIKALGGPVMIAQVTGEAARAGFSDFLHLLAFISIQLGILNLLPIPVLDGGHIFFYLFEMILRKPISLRKRVIAQQIGLAFLIGLMVLVTYNDIERTWNISHYIKKIGELFH